MALRPHLDTLLHYDPSRSSSTVHVWLAHPSPSEETALGKLVVLTSIDRVTRINHEIISLIQEELRAQYYQSAELTMDRAFERALQKTNERLHEVISEGVDQWVPSAHMLVVAIKQQHILLSNVGKMHAFMVRRERLHPLLSASDAVAPNPLRMFSQVVSGQAEPNDRMIFCTPSLLDYFSLEKLRRTSLDGHPSDVVRVLESTILGADPTYAMGAVVVEFENVSESIRPVYQSGSLNGPVAGRNAPQVSMDDLLSRQRTTEKILTPSIWPALADITQRLGQVISHFIRVTLFRRPVRRKVPTNTMIPAPTARRSTWWPVIGNRVRGGWSWLTVRFQALRPIRRPKIETNATPSPEPMAPLSRRRWFDQVVLWFTSLRRSQKISLAIVLIMVVSLTAALAQRTTRSNVTANINAPDRINQLISQAQAALLYGGDTAAQAAIQQADALVKQLPAKTKGDKTAKDSFVAKLAALHLQADRITTIASPKKLVDTATAATNFSPRQIYLTGNTLVIIDPKKNIAATSATTTAPIMKVVPDTLDTGTIQTGAITGTSSLTFVTDRQTFVELDIAKNQWKPLDATFPLAHPVIQFISGYLSKVYVLDTAHNDIVRFSRGGLSLGKGSTWLKAPAQLSQARSAVVDGSIFVLQPNGKVEMYQTGKKTDFQLSAISPALMNPTRLWTDAASTHLYLLDPENKRLVIFDKQGHLVDQYQSPLWNDLRDVTANEKTKTAYVMNGSVVQTVTLLH